MKTATQLEMAAMTDADAFGPGNLRPVIAGVQCSVINLGGGRVTVVDDRGAFHDFNRGETWAEIVALMEEYFGTVQD